jgi:VanZ family protein
MAEPAAPIPPRAAPSRLSRWLPVLLWGLLIYSASADSQSVRRTSRFIGPLVRWFVPAASDETISQVQFAVRKTAHATEYAILALLLWRALRRTAPGWDGRAAWLAFALAALFALSDEWHQSFVPNRQAHPLDVLIDSAGAAAALLVLRARLRR